MNIRTRIQNRKRGKNYNVAKGLFPVSITISSGVDITIASAEKNAKERHRRRLIKEGIVDYCSNCNGYFHKSKLINGLCNECIEKLKSN